MKLDFFKKFVGEGNDKKKQIENIVVFIIILIITVLIINNMWSEEKGTEEEKNINKILAQNKEKIDSTENDDLEARLENILESINGVGKAKVLIKYSQSSSIIAMYNETFSENKTEENDGEGGIKNIIETENQKEVVYDESNEPVTEKIVMPIIEGAIVTAQGAGNANIKASIVSAVEAVTGLPVHKIQVFEMSK